MINAAERLSKRVRAAMGDHDNDDLPVTQCVINMRKEVVSLQAENEALRERVAELSEALQAAEPIGWITEDYETDKSATTYNSEVAERWRTKGWPVEEIFKLPCPPTKGVRNDLESKRPY